MNKGHRSRLISRFLKYPYLFAPIDLLEVLLFFSLPRRDTKMVAVQILNKYGNIHAALQNIKPGIIKGIGIKTCAFLNLMYKLIIELNEPVVTPKLPAPSFKQLINRCRIQLYWKKQEELICLFINQKNQILEECVLAIGNHDSVYINISYIIQICCQVGNTTLLMAHNHPHGDPYPSEADINCTRQLQEALRHINIYLLDHVIISEKEYFSFKDNNLL